jgi:cyanate permease
MTATGLVGLCAIVPFIARPWGAVAALVAVNMGLGIWNSMYLTMAQEVSSIHVSTAAGTLSGFGSLVGALTMWAVGNVTESIGGFTIPMIAVTVAITLAAVAGWAATWQQAIPPPTALASQEA